MLQDLKLGILAPFELANLSKLDILVPYLKLDLKFSTLSYRHFSTVRARES